MEWFMIISFAGPFAGALSRNYRSRRDKRLTALFSCGASEDYAQAEAILADYKKASKRRYGIRHFEDRAWELVAANQPCHLGSCFKIAPARDARSQGSAQNCRALPGSSAVQ
jgi:hypothetical protein